MKPIDNASLFSLQQARGKLYIIAVLVARGQCEFSVLLKSSVTEAVIPDDYC